MTKLKIAVQKKGRLLDDSLELLKQCGISINNGKDQLKAEARDFPLEILYLRNSDIPRYLEQGVADIGVIGENLLVEYNRNIEIVLPLGFSKCRVSLALPKEVNYTDVRYFEGKKIATSYPNTLRKFLNKKQIKAEIHEIAGSVEIAPNIGLAEGICDIVSTGSTLFKNGLKEVEIIGKSQAVLAKSKLLSIEKQAILDRLTFRIESVLAAKNIKYVLMNVPNEKIAEVSALLPVLKSPTVMPLATKGWSSLHTVIKEKQFWEVIDQLKDTGAEGILVVPVEKMIL
ncbi:MAG: ATP phosphoribosyltransferase [Saprospiraceae bacterium]|jgi:ATP phosphoribosyltransferase